MALQEIIQQIESAAQEKIEQLEKEDFLKSKEVDKGYKKSFAELELRERKEMQKRKEEILKRKNEEAEYWFEMRMLAARNEILNKALAKIKQNVSNLDFEKKKEFLKKELQKVKNFLDDSVVFVCRNKKEMEKVLQESGIFKANIHEENLSFTNGFLVESKGFSIEVSLEETIEEILRENKSNFSKILLEN